MWHRHLTSNLAEKSARFSSVVKHPGSTLAKAEDWRRHVLEGSGRRLATRFGHYFAMPQRLWDPPCKDVVKLLSTKSVLCFISPTSSMQLFEKGCNFVSFCELPWFLSFWKSSMIVWQGVELSSTFLFSFLKSSMTEIMKTGHARCSACVV